MDRDEAISRIKSAEQVIRSLGAKALYLFGSTARNEAKPTSDVDIFIDRDPDQLFGVNEFCRMKDTLTDALGTEVDLATRVSLHPALKAEIERTAIRVL